jgi:uncharacterized protein with ParB-like and HNH nuclease domain
MDIAPDKQNIDRVFSNTAYFIDFYQRDYRWTSEPVLRLLDDIFYKFQEQYAQTPDLDPTPETVSGRYPWYYLNTYVTNVVDGRVYIVDGQQRLTTLSLILIKLRHLAKTFDSELLGWLEQKISGQQGFQRQFWMNHVGHRPTQQALYDGSSPEEIPTESGVTAQNMLANYKIISGFLDQELPDKHRFETFVFYYLLRLVLINLSVEQTDVSMVFEVINDRGVRLRPYEILKGKLLGQIDKLELDQGRYNELWETKASEINGFKEDELDSFFRFFLRAKFADTRKEGQRFDGDYHRAMFSTEMQDRLALLHNSSAVKKFLKGDFNYFTSLFVSLRKAYTNRDRDFEAVYFNMLLDLDAPFHLGLSVCQQNDPDETLKLATISGEIDRFFALLQLQNVYDSNEFADLLYIISSKIRDQPATAYRAVFDEQLSNIIATRRSVQNAEPFSYAAFKQTGIGLSPRFKRYFFARVEEFFAKELNLQPKQPIYDLVTKTGSKTGFHVEHILSHNDENLVLFDGDEDRFETERNRLGGILLLKGRDNISSNNESYHQKLKSYANTLYWNETLRADSYKSKLDMTDLIRRHKLNLQPLDKFGPEELESRQRLLFEISSIIWA